MDVDDDNLPAPENNVPPTSQTYNILSNNWGHDGVCFQKEKNYTNAPAKLTHPEAKFLPSWINAIDKSMSKWLNEFTCPGFMYVEQKPWLFGNEYQDAGCCLSDILWRVDLREGKDHPRHLGEKEHDNLGHTIGVLLRLTKPIWASGKVVVLDSGFCVLQGLVELLKKGVYAHALIKK